MATVKQIGILGNSIKVQELPTPNGITYGSGNRFYTLIGVQAGFTTGHTYRTNLDKDYNYYWEDMDEAGLQYAIPVEQKGVANGVATLNENGIVPSSQLPTIPTTTAQLQNNSGYVTETEVAQKIANLVGASKEDLDTLEELGKALDEHADEYDALLQQVSNKATKEELKASLIEMGINPINDDEISLTTATGTLASKLTVNNVNGITEPFHQMNVMVMMPSVVSSYLALSIDGGQNYHPIVVNGSDSFANYTNNTTAEKSRPMLLTYNANDTAATYLQSGIRIEVQGVWYIVNSTDKNDRVQIIPATYTSYNKWVHLVTDSATELGNNTSYGALLASKVLVNPYTGEVDAATLYEDGEALEDKYALKGAGGGGGASLNMPVIRVLTVADVDRTGIISPNNPLRITIATEGGLLRDDDEIQLCSLKAMTYKVCDEREDATRQRGRRWRYRKIAGKTAKECHPDKSMEEGVYRMICWDIGDIYTAREFFRSGNEYTSAHVMTKYVRVARLGDNDIYTHSNVVPIQFTVRNLVKPEKNEAKINVR
jgi:hypothetical protein